MHKHLITRILAGVATLAVAGGMAYASPAAAEANGSGSAAKKSCVNPETGKTDQPDGTVWTSKDQSGHIASQYKCNDGNWDKVDPPQTASSGGSGGTGGRHVYPGRTSVARARAL
jgi:hypothetical protein